MKYYLRFLLLAAFFLMPFCGTAQGLLQTAYTPAAKQGTIRSFLKDIRKRTQVSLSFSDAVVNTKKKVILTGSEHTVGEVLRVILADLPVTIVEREDEIMIVASEVKKEATTAKITINGYVRDAGSKEVLIGASVYIPSLNTGMLTNNYGFYSLTVPAGNYQLLAGYIGYEQQLINISQGEDQRRDLLLRSVTGMQEVKVSANKEQPADHIHLNTSEVNKYAALLGDNDVMRALQHQPGVQPGNDGSVGLIVRGGDPGQNLNLLDGVPIYFIDHFYGVSSVYNTDALKSVDFYKTTFPARFGGRISSVIDVNTRDGDMERIGGQVNIGILNGSLSLEGPVVKDKASMIVTARRSWMDLLWRPFDKTARIDFYDVNLKANYIINKSNRLYLSMYNGRDYFGIHNADGFNSGVNWGNSFIAAKWTTVLNPKVFVHTTLAYNTYRYRLKSIFNSFMIDTTGQMTFFEGESTIKETALRSKIYWYVSPVHKLEIGGQYAIAAFNPATINFIDNNQLKIHSTPAQQFQTNEAVLYAEDEIKLGRQWQLRLGAHWTNWQSKDFHYSSLQPRLYLAYSPSDKLVVYAAANRMAQFLHLLSNNTVTGFPTDFWLPSTAGLKPETSLMGSVGIKQKMKHDLDFGLELYYKDIQGAVAYKGGKNVFDNTEYWEQELIQGRGWSYGAELFVSKKAGPVSLSAAYTLSRSMRQFDHLNQGEAFPYRYDRRHNIKLDGAWEVRKGIHATASWTYMSGEALTLPDQIYPDFDGNLLNGIGNSEYTYSYTSWNNYRLPSIHRLDMAVNFVRRKRRHYERTWVIGIFNAYGRKNVVNVNLSKNENDEYHLKGTSVTGFMPTLSYRLKF